MYMRLLELFSGTHSVGKVAHALGYKVTSLDLANATICCDVREWDYRAYPRGYFDVIWASPPCDTFSCLKRCNIGRFGITADTIAADIRNVGLPLLQKAQEIIEYFQPTQWYIENPKTGSMKDHIDKSILWFDVDYCKYTDWGYRKRTRIWHSQPIPQFTPLLCKKDCGYVENGRHLMSVSGNPKGRNNKGQGGGTNRTPRYRIPPLLIEQLLSPHVDPQVEEELPMWCLYWLSLATSSLHSMIQIQWQRAHTCQRITFLLIRPLLLIILDPEHIYYSLLPNIASCPLSIDYLLSSILYCSHSNQATFTYPMLWKLSALLWEVFFSKVWLSFSGSWGAKLLPKLLNVSLSLPMYDLFPPLEKKKTL